MAESSSSLRRRPALPRHGDPLRLPRLGDVVCSSRFRRVIQVRNSLANFVATSSASDAILPSVWSGYFGCQTGDDKCRTPLATAPAYEDVVARRAVILARVPCKSSRHHSILNAHVCVRRPSLRKRQHTRAHDGERATGRVRKSCPSTDMLHSTLLERAAPMMANDRPGAHAKGLSHNCYRTLESTGDSTWRALGQQ